MAGRQMEQDSRRVGTDRDQEEQDNVGQHEDTEPHEQHQGQLRNRGDCEDSSGDDEEKVDPRVEENLEILNQSCAEVNCLENELDEARNKYRTTFQAASQRMEELGSKIKRNIQRARQYFTMKDSAKEAQNEAVRAARLYQTANGNYRAAKEMLTLAEQGLDEHSTSACTLTSAWQETLNHATARVLESKRQKTYTEEEHNKKAAIFAELEAQLHVLEKKYKRSIAKARPYFETKAGYNLQLQQLRQNVLDLQQTITSRKAMYAQALRNLEVISTEIHESRRMDQEARRNHEKLLLQFPREPGVGAETDSLGSSISDLNIERDLFSSSVSFDNGEDDEDSDEGDEVFNSEDGDGQSRPSRAVCKTSSCNLQQSPPFSSPCGTSTSSLSSPVDGNIQPQMSATVSATSATQRHPVLSRSSTAPAICSLPQLPEGEAMISADQRCRDQELEGAECFHVIPSSSSDDLNDTAETECLADEREQGDGGSVHEVCVREEELVPSTDQAAEECLGCPHGAGVCACELTVKSADITKPTDSGQVKKEPLRRTDSGRKKSLQGLLLLNPLDLDSSSPISSHHLF